MFNSPPVKIVADNPGFVPQYKTSGAACCDLLANIMDEQYRDPSYKYFTDRTNRFCLMLELHRTYKIDCGFKMALPAGWEAQVRARSGFGAKGIILPNGPGTIDDDYRGRMCVLLTVVDERYDKFKIYHMDRIAQMALHPVFKFNWVPVDTLDDTDRGDGGFGSTGV